MRIRPPSVLREASDGSGRRRNQAVSVSEGEFAVPSVRKKRSELELQVGLQEVQSARGLREGDAG